MYANVNQFVIATGGRPRHALPSTKWLVGCRRHPFRIGCTLKNGAVTNSDLTTQDAWYEDVQVRTTYNPADASTSRLKAFLSIEAVRVLVSSSVFSVLDATVKDDASAQLYIECDVGGQKRLVDMRNTLYEPQKEFQITQAAAANGTHWLLRGDWAEVNPGPVVLDLENTTFALKSLNTPAFGADITQCWVEVIGHMFPQNAPGAVSYIPGLSCSSSAGAVEDPRVLAEYANGLQQIAGLPSW